MPTLSDPHIQPKENVFLGRAFLKGSTPESSILFNLRSGAKRAYCQSRKFLNHDLEQAPPYLTTDSDGLSPSPSSLEEYGDWVDGTRPIRVGWGIPIDIQSQSDVDEAASSSIVLICQPLDTNASQQYSAPDALTKAVEGVALKYGFMVSIAPSPSRSQPQSTLDRASRLDVSGQTDAALDLLYDWIDELMRSGRFEELNSTIGRLDAHALSVDLLLGVLTATLPGRHRLPARARFLVAAAESLKNRGEEVDSLLAGL